MLHKLINISRTHAHSCCETPVLCFNIADRIRNEELLAPYQQHDVAASIHRDCRSNKSCMTQHGMLSFDMSWGSRKNVPAPYGHIVKRALAHISTKGVPRPTFLPV